MTAASTAPAEKLLNRLDRVKSTGPGKWRARCPAHDDRSPSLSVRETDDGTVLVRCWAGCGASDITAAVGMSLSDLFPKSLNADHRRPAPPRVSPRDILKTSITEAVILSLGYQDLMAGRALDQADQARVALAIETIHRVNREVVHGHS